MFLTQFLYLCPFARKRGFKSDCVISLKKNYATMIMDEKYIKGSWSCLPGRGICFLVSIGNGLIWWLLMKWTEIMIIDEMDLNNDYWWLLTLQIIDDVIMYRTIVLIIVILPLYCSEVRYIFLIYIKNVLTL